MKKTVLFLVCACVNTLVFAQGFIVRNFAADIRLNAGGYFDVKEKYDIEFVQAKHGIYRDIITEYQLQKSNGKTEKRHLVIENIDIQDHLFKTDSKLEQRTNGKIHIQIGDKNKLVSGLQHYEIRYRVHNAFLFEDSLVYFYWNIKPHGWLAIFENIHVNIHTPPGVSLSNDICFLYAGNSGSAVPSSDFDYAYDDGIFSAKSHQYSYSVPGQDVTVFMKLPANSVSKNFLTTPIWKEFGWVGILLASLIAFFVLWLIYGRDDTVVSVTNFYPPKGIDPAMAGYLINDKDDASDLIAFLPYWATLGIISIEEFPKSEFMRHADIKLTRLKNLDSNVPAYEQKIFDGLFAFYGDVVFISILRNHFYLTMNAAKKELKEIAQEYYVAQSKKIMIAVSKVAVALGVVSGGGFLFIWGPVAAVASAVTFVFIAFMSFFLQKKNSKGNVVLSELQGFRQFIKTAEIDRIKALVEQDPKYFEKTMSYAIAFGMLDTWTKKYDALNMAPPDWYKSNGLRTVSLYSFSRSFSTSIGFAKTSMVSSPSKSSSSGGGSSGGGFGGGGGGSW